MYVRVYGITPYERTSMNFTANDERNLLSELLFIKRASISRAVVINRIINVGGRSVCLIIYSFVQKNNERIKYFRRAV